MGKKTYISPDVSITIVQTVGFLCNSGVSSDDQDIDIPYGGIDEEGELTPGARRKQPDVWEEELEEEYEDF